MQIENRIHARMTELSREAARLENEIAQIQSQTDRDAHDRLRTLREIHRENRVAWRELYHIVEG